MTPDDTRTESAGKERTVPPAGSSQPGWVQVLLALRWPAAFVLVALIGFLAYRETLQQASRAASAAAEAAGEAVRGILSGNVTETFVASLPEFDPNGSGNLEVATLTATETFSRSDERKILWDSFSLGVTTTQIRVPVTYRYHLRLADPWHLEVNGPVCTVWAPPIRPSLPPAIHTDRMEKLSESDWLRFDADDQMARLERTITPTLATYAADERHLGVVRENARRAVEEFVKIWLLREEQWRIDRVHAIRVIFADEEGAEIPRTPLEIKPPEG